MNFRTLSFLLFFSSLSISIWSQPINNYVKDVVMPSPTATSFGKFGEIPVSYHTGVPNISIPIHTVTSGPLSVPISLSYHAAGIKSAEVSSWVGTGWALQTGGHISRAVMNVEDENTGRNGYYDYGINLPNSAEISNPQKLSAAAGFLDSEPDMFTFSIPGYSGKFLFDKNKIPYIVPRQDLKIITEANFNSFTIIDPNGIRYIFGKDGTKTAYETTTVAGNSYRSGWFLLKIETPDQKFNIVYDYSSEFYAFKQISSCKFEYIECGGTQQTTSCSGGNNIAGTKFGFVHLSSQRLTKITGNIDVVDFTANTTRIDLDHFELNTNNALPKRLDEISISSGASVLCNKYKLVYDYFEDSSSPQCQGGSLFSTAHCKKLRLLSLNTESCTANEVISQPHTFTYNGNNVDNLLSKRIDHWGYQNGATSNDNDDVLVPTQTASFVYPWVSDVVRESDETSMKKGVLTKITYPTGGNTSFDFEANRVLGPGSTSYQPLLPSVLTNCSYAYNNTDCCSSNLNSPSTNYTFSNVNDISEGYFKLKFSNSNCQSIGNGNIPSTPYGIWVVAVEVRAVGNPQILGLYTFNIQPTTNPNYIAETSLIPLSTLYASLNPNVQYSFTLVVSGGKGEFSLFKRVFGPPTARVVGGLRVKTMTNSDGVNTSNDIIRTYEYTTSGSSTTPSGKLYYEPFYLSYHQGSANMSGGPTGMGYTYLGISSSSVVPLSTLDGYHISYERVVESFNGNGKNEYFFRVSVPYNPPFGSFPLPPQGALSDAGAMISSKTYSSTNAEISSQVLQNEYAGGTISMPANMFSARGISMQCTPGPLLIPVLTYYQHKTFFAPRPTKVTSTIDGVVTEKNYSYDASNLFLAPRSEWTVNSDGKQTRMQYKYVHDLSAGSIKQYLLDKNMIAEPYEVNIFVGGSNGTGGTQTNGTRTTFASFNNAGTFVSSTSCAAGDFVRPREYANFEMTYVGSSASTFGWDTRGTMNSYNALGLPASFTLANWLAETYSWTTTGLLQSKTYNGYVTEVNYHSGTKLPSKIKQPDGQEIWYDYDQLGRLTKSWARPTTANSKTSANIVSEYEYRYKGQTTPPNPFAENYIKTTTTFSSAPTGGGTSGLTSRESVQYFDGLGRGYQTVNRKQSPAQKDVVMAVEYDKWGRTIKSYNPIESVNNTGAKLSSIPAGTPFALTEYYADPLNRLWKTTPPSWYATTMAYSANIANEVKLDHTANTSYAAGALSKTTVTDPDNKQVITYKDKKGRTIMVRRTNTANAGPADTYYIYDDKDRTNKVIPPGSTFASTTLNFEYSYDQSDNMLTKKIPDAASVSMKYNNRDQLVLSQDGNLLAQNKWMCTQYDDFGRVIKTGLFSGTIPNPITPTLTPNDLYTETQYGTSGIQLGKVTKNKTKSFDTGGTWLETNTTYDAFGRPGTTTGNNYLLPSDLNAESITFVYDFADNMLKDTRVSKKTASASTTITQTHNYDHWGRNTLNTHQIGTGTIHNISQLNYDWKNQLKERNIGKSATAADYLQSLDYDYNDMGWLKTINPGMGGANIGFPACPTVQGMPNPGAASSTPDQNDLFYLELKYDQLQTNLTGTANKNGNISQVIWRTRGRERQAYSLSYDYLNRMTAARYDNLNDAGTAVNNTNAWNENLTYDVRGNITALTRRGKFKASPTSTCWTDGEIDNLAYTYNTNTNRLQKIADSAPTVSKTQGWNNTAGAATTAQYAYDANGNMTSEPYKGMTVTYNFMNLPTKFTFTGNKVIDVLYDGGGRKLRKTVTDNGTLQYRQDYVGGIEYRTTSTVTLSMESIYHAEGRVLNTNTGTTSADVFRYEYAIRDHLGNTRLTFTDKNNDGKVDVTTTASTNEILQENHYYPFGMAMNGPWMDDPARNMPYQYNGKELNEDFGLGLYDYGARWYDASLGRFSTIDRYVDSFPGYNPYHYCKNAPFSGIDVNGDSLIVLLARDHVGNLGHAAVLIGNEKDGWDYYSKNGTTGSSGASGESDVNPRVNIHYDNLNQFANLNDNLDPDGSSVYTNGYLIATTSEQDKKMEVAAQKQVSSNYAVVGASCIDVASDALKSIGKNPGYVNTPIGPDGSIQLLPAVPNDRYKSIKENNKGTNVDEQLKRSTKGSQ